MQLRERLRSAQRLSEADPRGSSRAGSERGVEHANFPVDVAPHRVGGGLQHEGRGVAAEVKHRSNIGDDDIGCSELPTQSLARQDGRC